MKKVDIIKLRLKGVPTDEIKQLMELETLAEDADQEDEQTPPPAEEEKEEEKENLTKTSWKAEMPCWKCSEAAEISKRSSCRRAMWKAPSKESWHRQRKKAFSFRKQADRNWMK